jgi:hypothetical protein
MQQEVLHKIRGQALSVQRSAKITKEGNQIIVE